MDKYWVLWILVCVLMIGVWLILATFRRKKLPRNDEEELDRLLDEILGRRRD